MENNEKIELINSGKQMLQMYFANTEEILDKQLKNFEKLLASKIAETHKQNSLDEILSIVESSFAEIVKNKVNELFQKIKQSEIVFYEARLKTAELVFNSNQSDRNKTIYLDNQLKRIDEKPTDLVCLISELIDAEVDKKDVFATDKEFQKFVKEIFIKLRIQPNEASDIKQITSSYYERLKNDIYLNLENLLKTNKFAVNYNITQKMDESNIRNGKTTAASKLEKNITAQTIDTMENIVREIVRTNKAKTKEDLKRLSTIVISSIFVSLPEAYKDQRELLEVIVETNIVDRLGGILDRQIKSLEQNINEKNADAISNEFYEEKRYKNIPNYECNFDTVSMVYQDVLAEIISAYDLDKGEMKVEAKSGLDRINTTIQNITNSTKIVFNGLVDAINNENIEKLRQVLEQMHSSKFSESQKLVQSINEQNDIVTGYKSSK